MAWVPRLAVWSEEDSEDQVLEDGEEALDLGLGAEAGLLYNGTPVVTVISPQQLRTIPPTDNKLIRRDGLAREPSVQSDVTSHGSHGSSVESYLESRKPDPEEVLLSLGFGGPVSSLDSEVTRIPRRFLQPSKVKGVAIKDFLRHQQELIDNFETGFCGYRGLTGSSGSMPSIIVAKIMEKLREHERDNVNSTATSEYASLATTPPPDIGRRFSHHSSHLHHRHMLKRGSAASSSSPSPSSRQNASLSVLNADNRRFLESQGSKSPEVPRKRMIIGQRSFTFGRDGDLIELESPSASSREDSSIGMIPLPPLKPLVHKDSVLSSATDLSLTSVDSDSDTDERSGSYELHRRLRVPQSPVPVHDSGQIHTSTPYSDSLSSPTNISSFPEFESEKIVGTPIHRPLGIGKRMSSTSLSSWESDAHSSPVNAPNSHMETTFGRSRFSIGDPDEHRHKSSHSLLGNLPIRYESIEEDVEMKTESDISKESSCPQPSISEDSKSNEGLLFNIPLECSNDKLVQENKQDADDSVFTTSQPTCPPKVPISDEITSAQGRRGSLKRQPNVAEEDALELLSNPPVFQEIEKTECDENNSKSDKVFSEKFSILCDNGCESSDLNTLNDTVPDLLTSEEDCTESEDGLSDFEGIILPQLEIIDECLFKKDNSNNTEIHENGTGHLPLSDEDIKSCSEDTSEVAEDTGMMEPSSHLQVSRDIRGDSFEMEEIGNGEDEAKTATLTRARSDSSGFLDGDVERSENSENKAWEKHKTIEQDVSAEANGNLDVLTDTNLSSDPRLRGGSTGTVVPDLDSSVENKSDLCGFTKRLSLPVVCVMDETGGVLLSRSNSVHSISSDDTNSSSESGNVNKKRRRRARRVHSAPEPLALTSSCSSVSNMFSSCSDESVIHIDLKAQCTPIQPTAEGIASTFRTNQKDLQELLEELAVRGVNLSHEFDPPSFSSQPLSQCAPLQADAVRAALNTYSSQLGESMSSLQTNSELLECVVEARHELEIVRDIREQIAAELRRVASLLEEQPGPRAAAITRQMTVLLREQTRLCRQLEALSRGCGPVDSSFTVDSISRTFSAQSTVTTVPCCNSERLLGAVREENRRLERLVQGHSQELAEIRLLLRELVSKQN